MNFDWLIHLVECSNVSTTNFNLHRSNHNWGLLQFIGHCHIPLDPCCQCPTGRENMVSNQKIKPVRFLVMAQRHNKIINIVILTRITTIIKAKLNETNNWINEYSGRLPRIEKCTIKKINLYFLSPRNEMHGIKKLF